jgi:ABC-type amino acid transport substrate-binding protein
MNSMMTKYIHKALHSTLLLIFSATLSYSTQAEKPALTIYAIDLVYRLSENGTTQYNALLDALVAEGLEFQVIVRPLSRSLRDFKDDITSCIFPATINALSINDESFSTLPHLSSSPIDKVSLRLLTKADAPVISDLRELEGKNIAVINGLNPDIFFSQIDVSVESSASEEARIRMLNANRIDAVLGFVPDALLAAEALNIPVPKYSADLSFVSGEGVSIICHDTKPSNTFLKETNLIIEKLKKSGKLRAILGPHANLKTISDKNN